jgi:flagellar assembly protein FliH
MANLFEPIAEQDTQIEKSLVDLVQHITKQVIKRELAIDSSQIEHVMRDALKLLPLGVDKRASVRQSAGLRTGQSLARTS